MKTDMVNDHLDRDKEQDLLFEHSKVYIVSLQKNQDLENYYRQNKIVGGYFIEILNPEDLSKISDGDLIFFLSTEEVSPEFERLIQQLWGLEHITIAISNKDLARLNSVCISHIKTDEDFKRTHGFLKKLIECIVLPSLVCLDYADFKQLFTMSQKIEWQEYKTDYLGLDSIIKMIKSEFNQVDNCFLVIIGGLDLTLDTISMIGEKVTNSLKDEANVFWGARIDEHLNGKIELSLYVGWKK